MAAWAQPKPEPIAIWLALIAAFSIGIRDLCTHWIHDPWSLYSVSFIPLLGWSILREASVPPRRGLGLALFSASLLLYLGILAGDYVALARPMMALGLVGMLLFRGVCSIRTAALALWIVPLPYFIANRMGGEAWAVWLVQNSISFLTRWGVDLPSEPISRIVSLDGHSLALSAVHCGIALAAHLAGLGWYSALSRGARLNGLALSAFIGSLLALPLQFVASTLAVLALRVGSISFATAILETLPWIFALIVTVAITEARRNGVR